MESEITANEIRQLVSILDTVESRYRRIYNKISGGFVRSYVDFSNKYYIMIETWFGVQSDCDDTINHETFIVDRKTFKLKDSIANDKESM
jgi:hypothetical protein